MHGIVCAQRVALDRVSAAYFLRRSVPWTRAAPVLVIEADDTAYAYPRDWFVNEACDGFNIMPPYLPGALNDFIALVVPELQRRGLFRTEYEGRTLRENLGLPRPPSRWP